MADDEEKKENPEEKDSKKSKGSIVKWIVIIFVLLFIGGAGFGGWMYYKTHLVSQKEVKKEPKAEIGAIWPVGVMVVNLMDGNGERYLKATIQVETSNQECVSELDLLKPKITDNVLGLLSSKKYQEIVGFEGKRQLKNEIAMRLNSYLTKGRITHVYFTEFVIQ